MLNESRVIDPIGDGASRVQLIDMMGADLAVANDARASFERVSPELDDRDKKLIKYLVMHDHMSPLRGTVFKFRVTAPLFICRQWWKHIIGSMHAADQVGWNEKSYRYTRAETGRYYVPKQFFSQAESNRQASGGPLDQVENEECRMLFDEACEQAFKAYGTLLERGVSREQARAVLPQSVYTTWVWTASLQATLNFIELRIAHGAQGEIQKFGLAVRDLIADVVPVTMDAWSEKRGSLQPDAGA